MVVLWAVVGVVGFLVVVGLVFGRGAGAGSAAGRHPLSGRAPTEPGLDPSAAKDPFEYDEEAPMDWWDNQYGPHGFDD